MASKNNLVLVDMRPLQDSLKNLKKNVPIEVKKMLRNEARLAVEEAVDRTKPKVGRLKKQIKSTVLQAFIPTKKGVSRLPLEGYYAVRARQSVKPILANRQAVVALIKQQQSHVGWFASGFLGDGNPLGAKKGIPAYVKQHRGEGSTTIADTPLTLSITVLNKSRFSSHIPGMFRRVIQILNAVIRTRSYKIEQNLKLIRSGVKKYKVSK